jgi:hypothetical protein
MLQSHWIQVSALVGFLLPLVISVIQQMHWRNAFRVIVALVIIAIASTITAWAEGKLNLKDWSATLITIYLMTKTTYLAVWKPSGISPAIERKTQISESPGTTVQRP